MWKRFTERARKVVFYAQTAAIRGNAEFVEPEHLLLGILDDPDSMGGRVLVALGLDPARVRAEVEARLVRGEAEDFDAARVLSDEAKRTVTLAYEEARDLGNNSIGTEHLVLGLIRQGDRLAGGIFAEFGAQIENARLAAEAIQAEERGRNPAPEPKVEESKAMWQRFTERARKVVFYAQEEAQKFGEGYVSTEHLLLGLAREPGSVAARVLEKLGVSLNRVRVEVEKQLPRGDARPNQDMTLTPRAKRVIDLSYDEARNLNNNYIGTEHLLLGLIREGDGLAGRVLAKLNADLEKARREVIELQDRSGGVDSGREPGPNPSWTPQAPPEDPWARFADDCRDALLAAEKEAIVRGQSYRSPEHLLLGLLRQSECPACRALAVLEVDLGRLRRTVLKRCRKGTPRSGEAPLSPASTKAVTLAYKEQARLRAAKTGTGHLLLGLLQEPDGVAGRVLEEFGVGAEALRAAIVGLDGAEERQAP